MDMLKHLNEQKRFIKNILYHTDTHLKNLPDGRVFLRKRDGYYAIAVRTGGVKENLPLKEQYVSLKSRHASDFATRFYLIRLRNILQNELDALKEFERKYKPHEKYNLLSTIPKGIIPLIDSPLQTPEELAFEWAGKNYMRNTMEFDERYVYYTANGERVRSRAEVIISDILIKLGIPYRYEASFRLDCSIVYPDFTIMNPYNGEIFYIEYFGLMDNEEYRHKTLTKIREYSKTKEAGRFIFFFESDRISMDTLAIENTIIRRLNMPQSKG